MDADECLIQLDGSVRSYYWDGDYFKDSCGNSLRASTMMIIQMDHVMLDPLVMWLVITRFG